jgi:hypothetical protein
MTANMFSPTFIFSSIFSLFLLVHNSLRYLAYHGICLIASNNGMFTSTYQKVSKISFSISLFFCFTNRPRKGGWIKILEFGKAKFLLTLLVGRSGDSAGFSFLCWVLVVVLIRPLFYALKKSTVIFGFLDFECLLSSLIEMFVCWWPRILKYPLKTYLP